MTHSEAISILLDSSSRSGREQAKTHVAQCSGCWEILRLFHAVATSAVPAEADRMDALYGCDAAHDALHDLVGLAPRDMRARQPSLVRHLSWCLACRDLFLEIVDVEEDAARGAFGPSIAAPEAIWRALPAVLGRAARELVGRIAVELREDGLSFVGVPRGMTLVLDNSAIAWRGGDEGEQPTTNLCRGGRLSFDLGDTGLTTELTLEPRPAARVQLALRVPGAATDSFKVALRTANADRLALIAVETVQGDAPAVIRDVPAGSYLLELERRPEQRRFRMALTIASPPAG